MSRINLIDCNDVTAARHALLTRLRNGYGSFGARADSVMSGKRNPMKPLSIGCALALGLAFAVSAPAIADQAAAPAASAAAPAAPQLYHALSVLLRGHNIATGDYALALHSGNQPKERKAAEAVLANARQIGDAVAHFYGKAAGDEMFKLLAVHWDGVKALTDTTKAGDAAGVRKAMDDLASNATATAKFLADANPNWTEGALQGALMMHGNDHKTQIDEMMSNAPQTQQAKSWMAMQQHMDMIAGVLATGIAKQFPEKAHSFR